MIQYKSTSIRFCPIYFDKLSQLHKDLKISQADILQCFLNLPEDQIGKIIKDNFGEVDVIKKEIKGVVKHANRVKKAAGILKGLTQEEIARAIEESKCTDAE